MAAHRYWRLTVTAAPFTSGHTIAALQFRTTSGGSSVAVTGNGTSSASVNSAAAIQAFMNTGGWTGADVGTWIQWDFGTGNDQSIVEVALTNTGSTTLDVTGATLSFSDDGSAWTVLMAVSGSSVANATTVTTYVPPASALVAITVPFATVSARGGIGFFLGAPLPTLAAFGGVNAAISSPATMVGAYCGGSLILSSPKVVLDAMGHNSDGENAIGIFAPAGTVSAYGGISAGVFSPTPSLSISGTFTNVGTAMLALTAPTLSASGGRSGSARADITAVAALLVGYSGAVCAVTVSGKVTLLATSTSGAVGGAQIVLPLVELSASATIRGVSHAELLAPTPSMGHGSVAYLLMPGATLTAIGTAVVAVTYEAYALNLKHNPAPGQEPVDEMTRYTNYPFDRIMRYKNSYFGMNSTGLYLLEGTTDFAEPTPAPVQWNWRTTLTDFKSPQLKKLEVVYFGGRMPAAATVTVAVGEAGTESYNYTTPRGPSAQNYRQPLGKGMKARYYALGASGAGELALDTLTFNVTPLARKV
jgi:hypothetical protein